jgi:hypothetical protein
MRGEGTNLMREKRLAKQQRKVITSQEHEVTEMCLAKHQGLGAKCKVAYTFK